MKLAVLSLALCLVGLAAADCDVSLNIWIGGGGERRHHNRMTLPDGSTLLDGLNRASGNGNPFFSFHSRRSKDSGSSESGGQLQINSMGGFISDLM